MANPSWTAAGLPGEVERQGYRRRLPSVGIATRMESGARKRRRRFTAAPVPITMPFLMTAAERGLFETFFNDTLKGGTLAFDWIVPDTGAAATFAFVNPAEPPEFVPEVGAKLWRVVLELEILP